MTLVRLPTRRMMTMDPIDVFALRTIAEPHRLPHVQRDEVVEQILRSDPDLKRVLPELLATKRAKLVRGLGPLVRDSVT